MYRNIAIITARGGSKRIPKKNIKSFLGKPVIVYSIKAAIDSKLFDEVMVSTDSEEIANIAKEYGAKVPFYRSEATSNDIATTRDVLLEVVDEYSKRGLYFDNICCIYPVAPFVTKNKLIETYNILVNSECDSVIPMVRFSVPPQTGCYIVDGIIKEISDKAALRTQDYKPVYFDPGQFYWHKCSSYLKNPETHIKKAYIVSELEAQDVDNNEDWVMAELKYKLLHKI